MVMVGNSSPVRAGRFWGLPRVYHGGRCGPFRTSRQLGGMLRRHQTQWSFTVRTAQAHAGVVCVRLRTEVEVGVRQGRGVCVALRQQLAAAG